MIVKIAPNDYINTDHIRRILVGTPLQKSRLIFDDFHELNISLDAALHLLVILETDNSMVTQAEMAILPPLSIASRCAQSLRENFPYGATIGQLEAVILVTAERIELALSDLIDERIVVAVSEADQTLFYHASQAPPAALNSIDHPAGASESCPPPLTLGDSAPTAILTTPAE